MSIPVVDLSEIVSNTAKDLSPVLREIHEAFSKVGFVFITNHGIPRETIEGVFEESKQFFSLPRDTKLKYSRNATSKNHGYVALNEERIDPKMPGDLKECFNVSDLTDRSYPDDEIPRLRPACQTLFQSSKELSLVLLKLMGQSLKLHTGFPQDSELFYSSHKRIGFASDNLTTLRLLHYPPLPPSEDIQPGQLRCGEHVDYGSITLLFQDPIGGLQVRQASGEYINVPYIKDAILVNLGALMQNWTSDIYLATRHRVLLPEGEKERNSVRQSMAFFCHPDDKVLIECVDGSDKYPPVLAGEDLWNRLNRTYSY